LPCGTINKNNEEPGMKHPAFDIVTLLGQAGLAAPDPETLRSFRINVCPMRVYIPGDRLETPKQKSATRFNLDTAGGKELPSLPLYMRETDAIKAHGPDGYFAAKFRLALLFADAYRSHARLIDGKENLLIRHETLLALRDLNTPKPMSADEVVAQRDAMLTFATRARAYCAKQADVNSLYLATLAVPGAGPMLLASLSAERYARHATALTALCAEEFRPGWRFILLEEAPGHAALARDMWQTTPCYAKVPGRRWWHKIKTRFEAPAPTLAGLTQR
jgi:hypothetical protein